MSLRQPVARGVQTVSANSTYVDPYGKAQLSVLPSLFDGGRAIQTYPLLDRVTRVVALDCEMQTAINTKTGKGTQRVGRLSVVSYEEEPQVLYDVFAYYPHQEGMRKSLPPKHKRLGVYWQDINPNRGAIPSKQVEYDLKQILSHAEIVVGHAIGNDIRIFSPEVWEGVTTRDTQLHEPYRVYSKGDQRLPRLDVLAEELLGWKIQEEEHSSVEDAQATMMLYMRRELEIEREQGGYRLQDYLHVEQEEDEEDYGDVGEWEEEPTDESWATLVPAHVLPPPTDAAKFWSKSSATIKEGFVQTSHARAVKHAQTPSTSTVGTVNSSLRSSTPATPSSSAHSSIPTTSKATTEDIEAVKTGRMSAPPLADDYASDSISAVESASVTKAETVPSYEMSETLQRVMAKTASQVYIKTKTSTGRVVEHAAVALPMKPMGYKA